MAEICCGVVGESDVSSPCDSSSRAARRRRMEIRRFKFVTGVAPSEQSIEENNPKRQKLQVDDAAMSLSGRECENAVENCESLSAELAEEVLGSSTGSHHPRPLNPKGDAGVYLKYGVASVCGRRRDMEDAVAIHPSFSRRDEDCELHYFGVYDGHGCSHVAVKCRERLHELVKEELLKKGEEDEEVEWKSVMERSFARMDKEVVAWDDDARAGANCRCELQTPECDAVGSTAVVAIITPDKIIVANCGDSRAVLCRNARAIPLSSDHKTLFGRREKSLQYLLRKERKKERKEELMMTLILPFVLIHAVHFLPDRPDELNRIQTAGGRVIYWDGPRVLGVLAMSRAIGDNYLKPYVICDPEVTVMDRTAEDECLILASDGLWDVVSNEMACRVASKCLRVMSQSPEASAESSSRREELGDGTCTDASTLLTKLALAKQSADNVSVVVVDLRRDSWLDG